MVETRSGSESGPIATTRNDDFQALGTGGQLVIQAWAQVTAHLRRALGNEFAAFLAEPVPDLERGVTDWYARSGGPVVELEAMPPAEQTSARDELTRLYTIIRAEGDRLRASIRESERYLGEQISLALTTPSSRSVLVNQGRPVLVLWGHSALGQAPAPELLIGMLASHGAALGPMRILGPPLVVARRSWSGALATLAGLLILALPLALLWLDPMHSFAQVVWQCIIDPAGPTVGAELRGEQERETRLRSEIARLAQGLGDRRVGCSAPPLSERAEAIPPEAAPNIPASPLGQTDLERAEKEGAKTGKIQIVLAWDDSNDLDLAVICPSGERIDWRTPRACGGELDIDQNLSNIVPNPVENIVFATSPAPGRYEVRVANAQYRPPSQQRSHFRVTLVLFNEEPKQFTGEVGGNQQVLVTVFEVPAP
jgi:hypothetical protein